MTNIWASWDERWGLKPLPAAANPVFICSSGWRTGSTLVQRMICSSGEILIWGEPYGRAQLISQMSNSALALVDGLIEEWPEPQCFLPPDIPKNLEDYWIANLFPEPDSFREGFRAHLEAFLAKPAQDKGFSRFGLKEVRLSALDAMFLQWIFPDARFVFIVRNPWDAWSSAKSYSHLDVWDLYWSDEPIRNAGAFAEHWKSTVESFINWPDEACLTVRYEDLIKPDYDVEKLARHACVVHIDAAVLQKRIRGPIPDPIPLNNHEISLISEICEPHADTFGYTGPTGFS